MALDRKPPVRAYQNQMAARFENSEYLPERFLLVGYVFENLVCEGSVERIIREVKP
jgi:hypothetical protein